MDAILVDLVNYAFAISPLAFGILCVPPLTAFNQFPLEHLPDELIRFFQFLYSIVPPVLLKKSYVLSLVRDSTDNTTLTTYVSHMFVHGTYQHLLNNLYHLIGLGFPVFREFGGLTMNLLFLGGGIAGSLNFDWHQATNNSNNIVVEVPKNESLINMASKVFNSMKDSAEKTIDAMIPRLHMGASAGVCGLLGVNFILLSKDCVLCAKDIIQHRRNNNNKSKNSGDSFMFQRIGKLAYNLLYVTSIVSSMSLEYQRASTTNTPTGTELLFSGNTVIAGHEAHLQGFLFGASIACGLLLVKQSGVHIGTSNSTTRHV